MNFKKLIEKLVASNHSGHHQTNNNNNNHASLNQNTASSRSSTSSSTNDCPLSSILALPNPSLTSNRTSTDRSLYLGLIKQNIDNETGHTTHEVQPASSTNHFYLSSTNKPSANKLSSNRHDDENEITHLGSSCCCSNHFNNPSYCCENNKVNYL